MKENHKTTKLFTGKPKPCKVQSCSIFNISDLCFKKNECLFNAYLSAKNNKHNMVEGVLVIVSNGKIFGAVRHCWNVCDSGYYDVTKDFIWENEEFQKYLTEEGIYNKLEYLYFSCHEASFQNYEKDGAIEFKYDYSLLIELLENKQS